MVDVSGSMSGTPMEAAIALGILISEVTHLVFRDRIHSGFSPVLRIHSDMILARRRHLWKKGAKS
jgi:hypothetical protein